MGFIEVGVSFEPFTSQPAETAAHLWPQARNRGLSLVDRACLALDKALPVLTADRAWSELGLDIEIQVVR